MREEFLSVGEASGLLHGLVSGEGVLFVVKCSWIYGYISCPDFTYWKEMYDVHGLPCMTMIQHILSMPHLNISN